MTRWKNESHWRSHDMVTSILKIDSSCSATWTLQRIARDNDVVNENIIDQINRNFDMDDFFKFRFQYRKIVNYRKNNYPSIIEWWFEIGKVAIPWQIIFRRITILRSYWYAYKYFKNWFLLLSHLDITKDIKRQWCSKWKYNWPNKSKFWYGWLF